MKQRKLYSITEKCKRELKHDIDRMVFKSRMDCLHFVMGYFSSAGFNSIPIDLIKYIDNLYYDGILIG